MIILGIETSCDETGCAVVKKEDNRITILSNVVASSANLQSKYGGIIPEQAAREQIKSIIPVIEESLQASGTRPQKIDAIAVTYGPGLIGSLLVGVETAKTLAKVWNKPLIPINHLLGHFYANWIINPQTVYGLPSSAVVGSRKSEVTPPAFPCIGLLVSGGHTDLVLFKDHNNYQYLGGTRDDAAGECFDKCARLLNLPYPGGPQISKLAENSDSRTFDLPRPMITSKDYDFSFSGLKTAVANLVNSGQVTGDSKKDLAASLELAIVDVLVDKTLRAAKNYKVKNIMIAGGVAANKKLCEKLKKNCQFSTAPSGARFQLFIPPANLCTDNAAMIAAAGFFSKPITNLFKVQADPSLALS